MSYAVCTLTSHNMFRACAEFKRHLESMQTMHAFTAFFTLPYFT